LRKQGVVSPDDQKWFITNVLKVASDNGLVRIGAVGFTDPIRKDYFDRMKQVTMEYGIELRVFDTLEKAVNWMMHFADDMSKAEIN
jgi:hypothetical protein